MEPLNKLKRLLVRSLPLLTLLAGIALSAFAAYSSYQRITDEAQAVFTRQLQGLEQDILSRFEEPMRGMRGLAGLYNASQSVKRSEFHAYWEARDFAKEFPGIRGFGYIEEVHRSDLQRFIALQRKDGAPDFKVNTQGGAEQLFVVKLVEPVANNRAAIGLDLGAEPVRRAAVSKALETGQPVLSGTITLVQDGKHRPGFLYLLPLPGQGKADARTIREKSVGRGLVYCPISIDELLERTVFLAQGLTRFALFDGTRSDPAKLIFDSNPQAPASTATQAEHPLDSPMFTARHVLSIEGHFLNLQASSTPAFTVAVDRSRPILIGGGGIVLTLLLSLALWLMSRGQTLAEEKARLLSADLARLARVAEHTSNTVIIANEHLQIEWVNDAFVRITGYQREEAIGKRVSQLRNSSHTDAATLARIHDALAKGEDIRVQTHNLSKGGREYWLDADIHVIKDEKGAFRGYVAVETDITAIKLAEAELLRERQRLDNIILGTNVGTWEINLLTGESVIDERWAAMLGYRLDELRPFVYEKWTAMVHPEDMQESRARLAEHVKGKTDYYECEHRARHKNGHWVWVLSRGRIASRTPDGQVEWFAGTHMDVTDRRALHDQLQDSNRMLTAIMDNLPCGLSVFDADLDLVLQTPLFKTLLGLPDSLLASAVVSYEDIIRFNVQRGEFTQAESEAIIERARRPVPHRVERRRPNGLTLEIRNGPMPGGGLITTYTDITEQKKAEAEAHRSDVMLRASIDALDEAFVLYDPQDRMVLCNQRYKDVYPIAAEVMVPGNTFEEIVRFGAERGEYKAAIGRVEEWVVERMQIHRAANTDLIQELENGTVLRILERKTPEGYIVGFRIDITDLVRAKEAAEIASRSKSQFLANMSHEIRTPMNAILGMLNLLQGTELDTRQLDYVSKTEGAAKSLLGLLNDILDFSKVEAGKMSLEPHDFRMDQLIRDLGVILSASIGTKEVEVFFDLDPRLPVALIGDSLRLKQILINLGGNALKFTERGEVVVRTRVIDLQAQQVMLEFSVRDTGIGIASENVQRIFEGFSQAEASTTRRFGGTGLGLAISSRLVALMGGQLELDSELGKGSNFHFTVTLGVGPAPAEASVLQPIDELSRLRVLIIDDSPVARQIMQGMVNAMGWQAEFAQSGEQALIQIEAHAATGQPPFQAIFLNWHIPGMDGWETSRKIRHAMAGSTAPILVMVTAHGRELLTQRSAWEQSLLGGYLVKPVTSSMLFDAVLRARSAVPGTAPRQIAQQIKPRHLCGMRVLVVEDNKINQQVAQELLTREGAQITLADNGELGVQAVRQARPGFDIVLMDLQMPVMDGFSATRAIRQLPGFQALPIIAMTANAMASDRQECLDAGMNDHVGKPFNLDQLVQTLLDRTGYAPPAEEPQQEVVAQPIQADLVASEKQHSLQAGELDFQGALQRLDGDINLLTKILKSFANDLPRLPEQLAAHLQSGRLKDACRLMHTLKGTAATIGANQLSAVAAQAEASMKAGLRPQVHTALQQSVRLAIDATQRDLALLLQQLQPDAGAASGPSTAIKLDRAQLLLDLRELLGLLGQSNIGSVNAFSRLQELYGAGLQAELDPLGEAMAGLDYALASTLCEALSQKYTV